MKKRVIYVIIALILYIIAFVIKNTFVRNVFFVISYLIVGLSILKKAWRNILRGKVFDENFLMSIATLGAFCIGEFPEAVAVMLFYQIGELFQSYAVDKSRKSISSLMDIRPDYAVVFRNGKEVKIDPDDVKINEEIIVKPGEKIPLDGIIIDGKSLIDMKALTGESVPRKRVIGEEVLSGSINITSLLKIKVTKEFEESTVSKILDLVENASNKKSKSENFITKFAKYYTPIVVIIAVLLVFFPTFLGKIGVGIFAEMSFSEWIYRALSFLVVSCPCALVISIPLSFFGGIGGAAKMGVLIKGSNYLEALAKTEIVVFDKTGTLTKGVFEVQNIVSQRISENELLRYSAYAEYYSNHPIANSIKQAYKDNIDINKIEKIEEVSGYGIKAKVEGKIIYIGNEKLMKMCNIEINKTEEIGTILYCVIDNKYCGYIVISDIIKDDSLLAIKQLKQNGVKKTVMLTGDRKEVGEYVAKELKLDDVYTELLPDEKVRQIENLLKQKNIESKLAFVGDGINDSPSLAISDIGIAMGAIGSDSAIEAADVVLMTDEPSKISRSILLARKNMKIVKENIVFAILIKVAVLILSACGLSTMWEAVFADVGVSIIAIINSLRMLYVKN